MCTVTWLRAEDGYRLVFNRDELRTRKPADTPRASERLGTRYLAPRDGEAGGTWIAVNEYGLTVCLLNDYEAPQPPVSADLVSRGHLVASLARMANEDELRSALRDASWQRYRPFVLLVVDPRRGASSYHWDGRRFDMSSDEPAAPLCSSGSDPTGAGFVRGDLYRKMLSSTDPGAAPDLLSFHRSHEPQRGPLSPCMHREDAATLSLCEVVVRCDFVSMRYADGPPCTTPLGPPLVLQRLNSPVSA